MERSEYDHLDEHVGGGFGDEVGGRKSSTLKYVLTTYTPFVILVRNFHMKQTTSPVFSLLFLHPELRPQHAASLWCWRLPFSLCTLSGPPPPPQQLRVGVVSRPRKDGISWICHKDNLCDAGVTTVLPRCHVKSWIKEEEDVTTYQLGLSAIVSFV